MNSSRRHHEPLPLEARKVLWRKVWDRLLAPPPLGSDRDDPIPADLGTPAERPAGREGER